MWDALYREIGSCIAEVTWKGTLSVRIPYNLQYHSIVKWPNNVKLIKGWDIPNNNPKPDETGEYKMHNPSIREGHGIAKCSAAFDKCFAQHWLQRNDCTFIANIKQVFPNNFVIW